MVTVAIVAVISAIAVQVYSGYIGNANDAVLSQNIDGIRPFEEDFKLRTGAYGTGTYNKAINDFSLFTNIGWKPSEESTNIAYVVTLTGSGGYQVVATAEGGDHLTKCFGTCP